MSLSSDGSYKCTCPSSYTIIGEEAIGTLSCVLDSISSSYSSDDTAATVEYHTYPDIIVSAPTKMVTPAVCTYGEFARKSPPWVRCFFTFEFTQ